jgi:hypothetical protein
MSKWVISLSYINLGGDSFRYIDIAKVLNILEVQKSSSNNDLWFSIVYSNYGHAILGYVDILLAT